jgi:hypothetical protein
VCLYGKLFAGLLTEKLIHDGCTVGPWGLPVGNRTTLTAGGVSFHSLFTSTHPAFSLRRMIDEGKTLPQASTRA